jgi:small-conductance mechanosensitive channel
LKFLSDFTFIASLLTAVFVIIAMAMVGFPFIVAMCLTLNGSKYVLPL